MSVQLSVAVRNARLNAVETTIGTSPKLRFYTGSQPLDCATAASGTLLAELTPTNANWMEDAATGSKTIAVGVTFTGVGGATPGTIGYYRMYDSAGTTCHEQGSVTTVAVGTGDLLLDNTNIATNQNITISTWTKTDGNA